eukprot:2153041-Amphidinium_carterae.1
MVTQNPVMLWKVTVSSRSHPGYNCYDVSEMAIGSDRFISKERLHTALPFVSLKLPLEGRVWE